jgi:hypothetical protein
VPFGTVVPGLRIQGADKQTIGLSAIVGRDLAADLGMSLPAVFAGTWALARK